MHIDDKLVILQRRGHWWGNGSACQEAPGHSSMPVAVSSSAEGIRLERHSSFLQKTREQAADACWKGSCQPPQQEIPSQESFIGWSKQGEWQKSPEGVWSHTQQMLMLRQIPEVDRMWGTEEKDISNTSNQKVSFFFVSFSCCLFFRLCSTVSLWITYVLINYSAVDIVVNKLLVKWCWGPALIKQSFCTMCQDIWTSVCSLTQFPTRNWGVYSTWPSLVNMNHYLSWLGT